MSELRDQITRGQNALKRLTARMPGFRGYIERNNRRDADELLRDTLASQGTALWDRLNDAQRQWVQEGQLQAAGALEGAARRWRTWIDRVRHAASGYAGWFDAVQVLEPQLDQLYQFDLKLFDVVDQARAQAEALDGLKSDEERRAAAAGLDRLAQEALETLDERAHLLSAAAIQADREHKA